VPDGPRDRAVAAGDEARALDPCVAPPGQVGGTDANNVDDGTLPRTGSDNLGLVALGLALLASGGAVVYAVHRAQRPASS
jgi:LPXTG-motif cell wall-anchored protein